MKLLRLEIVGFKSFAEKVTLNFADGITSVVGPNGCGKSNIVDAIRWAMGEQSAKHLRGGKMEDVIFNGSASRGPMGMAEVTLTLKNDGVVPSEYAHYDEIAVRRRLFRDGQSEYSINKTPVRLKDVHDVFLGTGVGTRAYSMIEQGRIGFIVNSKPEDRRFLIEEVAGITKYKARKKVAQRRMEATEQNLLRVSDVVSELARQLGSLERQAQKAERYKRLKAELKELELWVASHRFLELRARSVFAENQAARLGEDEAAAATELATADTRLETERLRLSDREADNARRSEQVHGLDARLKVLERDLELYAREQANSESRGEQASEEVGALDRQKQTIIGEIEVLSEHAETLGGETERTMADLELRETRLRELTAQRRALETEAQQLQKAMLADLTALAEERAKVESGDRRRIELEARRDRNQGEREALEAEQGAHAQNLGRVEGELERLVAQIDALRDRLAALEDQVQRGKQTTAFAEAKILSIKEEAGERKSRLQSLIDIEKKFEGYAAGVRAIMTGRGEPKEAGVVGLVADIVSAKPEHEQALEAVLGERLQYVIVESQARGVEAIDFLKTQAEGRGSFIPLDVKGRPAAGELARAPGVIGRLSEEVSCQAGYENIVAYLLGGVVLTDSLETACEQFAGREGFTYVSLAGEVVDPHGVLSGGKTSGSAEGILKQKREIKELTADVRRLENDLILAENQKVQAQAALAASEELLKSTRAELHESEIKKAKTDKDLVAEKDHLRRAGERGQALVKEQEEIAQAFAALEGEVAGCKQRMQEAQAAHATKERALGELTERDATLRDDESIAQEELTQLKVAFAQRDEKQKNVLRTLDRLKQNLHETEERIARAHQAAESGTAQAKEYAEKIVQSREERDTLLAEHATQKDALSEGRAAHDALVQEVRALEEQSRVLARRTGALREERAGFEMKAREHLMHLEHLWSTIHDAYELDLFVEVTDFHMRGLGDGDAPERIAQLKSQLAKMGDINLMAIEEFEAVKSRHDFLATQKIDLEQALSELRSAIMKINRTSRQRFEEAFHATNAMFQKVFPRLFRGGEARLELVMEGTDDILEAGIEIISQPPGKKLQSVQLLSGGEKALTAVSLVFSIFLIKPSPFCVLDEVDAPLDESNVMRFNELLREISQVSQFIVITHSKKTMECADRLYGITMEEPGISKLVSVNLSHERTAAHVAA